MCWAGIFIIRLVFHHPLLLPINYGSCNTSNPKRFPKYLCCSLASSPSFSALADPSKSTHPPPPQPHFSQGNSPKGQGTDRHLWVFHTQEILSFPVSSSKFQNLQLFCMKKSPVCSKCQDSVAVRRLHSVCWRGEWLLPKIHFKNSAHLCKQDLFIPLFVIRKLILSEMFFGKREGWRRGSGGGG